jgi:hypothetical protein
VITHGVGAWGMDDILNDIGRNSFLGNRKKIAKFLMSNFTCRSTFLYVCSIVIIINSVLTFQVSTAKYPMIADLAK